MIPKFRAWNTETKEIEVFNTYEEISELFLVLSADDGFYSIMQSTGLFDKNGKEVFVVGDIIKCTRGCPHEVYLEKEYGGTFFGGMPAIYLKGLLSGYAWTGDEEIIGNVYQNPELLEVTE